MLSSTTAQEGLSEARIMLAEAMQSVSVGAHTAADLQGQLAIGHALVSIAASLESIDRQGVETFAR